MSAYLVDLVGLVVDLVGHNLEPNEYINVKMGAKLTLNFLKNPNKLQLVLLKKKLNLLVTGVDKMSELFNKFT